MTRTLLAHAAALLLLCSASCAHPGGPGQANAELNNAAAPPPQGDVSTEGGSERGAAPFSTPSQTHKKVVPEESDGGASPNGGVPAGALPSGSNAPAQITDGGVLRTQALSSAWVANAD